jgi:hypothetical protein
MYRKIIGTCVALVALGAFAVLPAMAAASPELTDPVGTTMVPGAKLTAIGEETSEFTSGFITVKCNDFRLTGEVHANTGTSILVNVTKATFHDEVEGVTKDCTSGLGETAVSVPALDAGTSKWCIKANSELGDKGIVEPHACTGAGGAFTFKLHVTNAPFLGTQLCIYTRTTNINGSFTTANPSTLKLEGEPAFTREEGSSGGCSAEGKLKVLNTRLYTDTSTEALSTGDPVAIS